MPVKTVIIYHSAYGHTARVAEAVAEGAAEEVRTVPLLVDVEKMDETDWDALDAADVIVFGCPTYMGGVSGAFKIFIDNTSKRWFTQSWKDKVAGGFTNSGAYCGDKLSALMQMNLSAMQHGMIWVGPALPTPSGDEELGGAGPEEVNRLGSSLGVMTYSTNAAPELTPPQGDLETARLYGARLARVTARLKRGHIAP